MMSFHEFEESLALSIRTLQPQMEVGLAKVGEFAEKLAKSYIGHEQEAWAPLAASTLADKAAKGYDVPAPLLRTGELRDSITHEVLAAELAVVVGSTEKIAAYQELGTSRIPPRPFIEPGLKQALPLAEEVFGKIAVEALTGKPL
jgi:HK97 gp10 family phage protein